MQITECKSKFGNLHFFMQLGKTLYFEVKIRLPEKNRYGIIISGNIGYRRTDKCRE